MGSLIRRAGASCSIRRASSRLSCFVNRQPRGVVKIGIPRLEVTGFTRMGASARRPGRRPATWPSHPDKGVTRLRGRVFPRALSTALYTALSTALSLTKGHRSPARDVFLSTPTPREGGAHVKQPLVKMMALFVAVAHIVQTQRRFNRVSSVFLLPGNSGTRSARGDVVRPGRPPGTSSAPRAGDVSGSQAFYQVVHDTGGARAERAGGRSLAEVRRVRGARTLRTASLVTCVIRQSFGVVREAAVFDQYLSKPS